MPSLFFRLLDDFLHLVKNQRDSADSFVWYSSRVENVFFNNCLNWKGLWNDLSRALWQLHFYFIPSRNNKRARGYSMCMCVCLTLISTCIVNVGGMLYVSVGSFFLLFFVPNFFELLLWFIDVSIYFPELVSVCWKLKSLLPPGHGVEGQIIWSKMSSNSNLICFYDTWSQSLPLPPHFSLESMMFCGSEPQDFLTDTTDGGLKHTSRSARMELGM